MSEPFNPRMPTPLPGSPAPEAALGRPPRRRENILTGGRRQSEIGTLLASGRQLAQARSRTDPGQPDSGAAPVAGAAPVQSWQLFEKYEKRLAPREGGTADRPPSHDRGGLTHKGISMRFLLAHRKQNPQLNLPADPRLLTPKQRSDIFYNEYFLLPNVPKVAAIPAVMKQAPQLPEQLFDSSILSGPEDAGKFLQEALDNVLGTDLKVVTKGNREYDGIVGSKTRATIAEAARRNKLRDVNNEMAIIRERILRSKRTFSKNPGWIPRVRSFRIP